MLRSKAIPDRTLIGKISALVGNIYLEKTPAGERLVIEPACGINCKSAVEKTASMVDVGELYDALHQPVQVHNSAVPLSEKLHAVEVYLSDISAGTMDVTKLNDDE